MLYTVWIRINFGITVIEESPTVRLKEEWSQILTFFISWTADEIPMHILSDNTEL